MSNRKDTLAAADWQARRTLQATLTFKSLSQEEQIAISAKLANAYFNALSAQPNFDADEALQSLQDDGLAAEFLNQVAFPQFVSDLIKGVFDAEVAASIKQMEAYRDLVKAGNLPLSKFAGAISDKAATKYLDSISSGGDQSDNGKARARSSRYSKSDLKAARLSLARQQRRLLRQTVLIGLARLLVDRRIKPGKAFLGIKAEHDRFNLKLREKILKALPDAKPARRAEGSFDAFDLTAPAGELSGKAWVLKFPGSSSPNDLEPAFRNNVNKFLAALKQAGAAIRITSTFRPPERAYLMHWSWKIVRGQVAPKDVPPRDGVAIIWNHGDDEASKRGAQEMVNDFGIGGLNVPPALNSRHIERKAIDVKISWNGALNIRRADGQPMTITSEPRNEINPDLIKVGATYNVIHFLNPLKDKPHWSTDGR